MNTLSPDLTVKLAEHTVTPNPWVEPLVFDLNDPEHAQELGHMLDSSPIRVTDPIEDIAGDLFEYANPSKKGDEAARADFIEEVKAEGPGFGRWVFLPWSNELIRFPDPKTHFDLRTSRNRNAVTYDEQRRLYYGVTLAAVGLSVGSHVVTDAVMSGIGDTVVLADRDTISPSNLNRLDATYLDIGTPKVDFMAKKISKVDPYVRQVHFRDGITSGNIDYLRGCMPDILADEVDDLATKALLRRFAEHHRIPLLMATDLGDNSILDVERYDQGTAKPFNGRLSEREVDQLITGALGPSDFMKVTRKITGLRHVSTRMLQSVMEIGNTLPGITQLGVTASVGGAMTTRAAREILLGRPMPSGRYVDSPKNTMSLSSPTTVGDRVQAIRKLAASRPADK